MKQMYNVAEILGGYSKKGVKRSNMSLEVEICCCCLLYFGIYFSSHNVCSYTYSVPLNIVKLTKCCYHCD